MTRPFSDSTVFHLEEDNGKVTIDMLKASEHVRHVLNEMRRNRPASCIIEVYIYPYSHKQTHFFVAIKYTHDS